MTDCVCASSNKWGRASVYARVCVSGTSKYSCYEGPFSLPMNVFTIIELTGDFFHTSIFLLSSCCSNNVCKKTYLCPPPTFTSRAATDFFARSAATSPSVFCKRGSAPAVTSSETMCSCPRPLPRAEPVLPAYVVASTSAPCARRNCTIWPAPVSAAWCKGVRPLFPSRGLISAPAWSNSCSAVKLLWNTQTCTGVNPSKFRTSSWMSRDSSNAAAHSP